jgi:cytoskeleton protein RodZ
MMEQETDKQQDPAAEESTSLNVGATLREARERMGLTVEDVVNRLKFAPRQIRALEEDAFDQLPEGAFLRGFVRSYARLLLLDEAPLLEALPGVQAQEVKPAVQQSVEVPFPGVYSARKSNIMWLAAALLVAVALVLFTWLYGHKPAIIHTTRETQPVQLPEPPASAVPSVAPTAPAAPTAPVASVAPTAPVAMTREQQPALPASAPDATHPKVKFHVSSGTGPVHMIFDEGSWVEVKDKDGNVLMSQINPAGSEQYLDGDPPFAVTIGHTSGVKLFYKGKQIDLGPSTSAEVAHVTLE